MTDWRWIETWILLSLLGCAGTSSGNPVLPGNPPVPRGAALAKSDLPRERQPALSDSDAQQLASDNRNFAFDLYGQLHEQGSNLFFSPFSISLALAMTYAGARTTTEAEMANVMHFSLRQPTLHAELNATEQALLGRKSELAMSGDPATPTTGTGFELQLVNQAWGQKGYTFLGSYLDVLAKNYGAGLFLVDFASSEPTRLLINGWVQEQTAQRIKDLLPPKSLNDLTKLVLTNAIYFKASWLSKFDPKDTQDGVFHASVADRTVPMMHNVLEAQYGEGAGYRALELPYLSPSVRILLILPATGDLAALQQSLDETLFDRVRSSLGPYLVTLTLPKWSFESANKLKAPLQALGMQQAFAGAADFSGIDGGSGHLFIDEVYHKAFVAVDEQGTEAAASTAVVLTTKDVLKKPSTEIAFDQPFVFLVYDEPTGQILFLGQLVDPG
jgi:serpin B